MTYRIVRMYFNKPGYHRAIMSGLTLEEAEKHCKNPETSSSTCTNAVGKRRTKELGPWFDGFEAE